MAQRREQTACFPNQIAEGSFTPHTTIVEVGCFQTAEVETALVAGDLMPVRKDIQALCHEMTHWFDFFGTIWGRSYIGDICRAYRAQYLSKTDTPGRAETGFPDIVKLFDVDRAVLSPEYYRFSTAPSVTHTAAIPWTLDYTAGLEIGPDGNLREDKPIFMARFGENPSRKSFARQPLTVGALIEVRAIASEMGAAFAAINSHPEEGPRKVEKCLAEKEFEDLIYNHKLIEYTTAAHILSIQAGTKDFFLSARLASALAFIALNLKSSDFQKIRVPDAFVPWRKKNYAFKKRQDRGYAFAAMVFNGGSYDGDEVEYIGRCVASSNLGTPAKILEAAAEAMKTPAFSSDGDAVTAHFVRESALGSQILETHSRLPLYGLTFEALLTSFRAICPPFMLSDLNFYELSKGRIDEYRPEMMHDAAHDLRGYTRNILTGCRGV
jgi:hypothetical protein